MMSKGNSEWDKVCQVARWGLQISFCSLALLFELFKACSGEMRTISMTICTVSYKEEAFFFRQNFCITQLLQQPAICGEEKKKYPTSGLHNVKTLILLTSCCLEWKTYPYKPPVMSLGYPFISFLDTSGKKRSFAKQLKKWSGIFDSRQSCHYPMPHCPYLSNEVTIWPCL